MRTKAAVVSMAWMLASLALAGPNTVTYQGCVVSGGGAPVADGNYTMRFSIFTVATGGSNVWQETDANVTVTNGLFSTTLGDGTLPFGSLFSTYAQLWLEVAIDLNHSGLFESNETYAPRQKLAGAAWAIEADRLQGKQSSDFAAATHNHAGMGDITGVAAGTGLSGGGTSGNVTLSANTGYLQRRVTGSAAPGQFIRAINPDGSVVAAADQDTHDWPSITGKPATFPPSAHGHGWGELTGIPAGFADGVDNDSGGDITAVTAGTGLTGGGVSGSVSLAADTTYLQRRITGFAPIGQFIRAINADGSVVMAPDQVGSSSTSLGAVWGGFGLTGGGTSGTVILSADFGGSGSSTTVARSDHNHDAAYVNEGQANSVTSAMITNGTILFEDIAANGASAGRVIKYNGTAWIAGTDNDTLYTAGTGLSLAATQFNVNFGGNGTLASAARSDHSHAGGTNWSLAGNAGTTSGTHFLGTTNAVALDLRVNGRRGLRIEPHTISPSLIGGHEENSIASGVYGATIGGGGGGGGGRNLVTGIYGTIGGGYANQATSDSAVVAGGHSCVATGIYATIGGGDTNAATRQNATVAGGGANSATEINSTVGGGYGGVANGPNATIGGGFANQSGGDSAVVAGGARNVAGASYSTVAGGAVNNATGESSAVGGGVYNEARGYAATVGGGGGSGAFGILLGNVVSGSWSTIGGGALNYSTGTCATVGGGAYNEARGYASTIGGGGGEFLFVRYPNVASGDWSLVGGGAQNTSSQHCATVAGGWSNQATGESAAVLGGQQNFASGGWSAVGGGRANWATGESASVGGGFSNTASNNWATVGGGVINTASGPSATVGGGASNSSSDDYATVGGGYHNTASGSDATVGGGMRNESTATSSTIGGGSDNDATSAGATVGGGAWNVASGYCSTVGGGGGYESVGPGRPLSNVASGRWCTIGGGVLNTASGRYVATIAGGEQNTSSGSLSTIGGGLMNLAGGDYSSVGGGDENRATAHYATIPGGHQNRATAWYTFAAGTWAYARHQGAFVWSDFNPGFGYFFSHAENEFSARATGGVRFVSAVSPTTAGVELPPGGGSWISLSDRNAKENFAAVEGQGILERLAAVPIQTWNLKTQDPAIRHVGPMAQDFYAAFGVGENDKHINTVDADGVALAAIQGLYRLLQEKAAEIAALKADKDRQIAAVKAEKDAEIGDLKARVEKLETMVAAIQMRNAEGTECGMRNVSNAE